MSIVIESPEKSAVSSPKGIKPVDRTNGLEFISLEDSKRGSRILLNPELMEDKDTVAILAGLTGSLPEVRPYSPAELLRIITQNPKRGIAEIPKSIKGFISGKFNR